MSYEFIGAFRRSVLSAIGTPFQLAIVLTSFGLPGSCLAEAAKSLFYKSLRLLWQTELATPNPIACLDRSHKQRLRLALASPESLLRTKPFFGASQRRKIIARVRSKAEPLDQSINNPEPFMGDTIPPLFLAPLLAPVPKKTAGFPRRRDNISNIKNMFLLHLGFQCFDSLQNRRVAILQYYFQRGRCQVRFGIDV